MKFATTKISLSIAALSAVLTVSPVAADNQAARIESPQTPAPTRQGSDYSDRAQMKGWSNEKVQLERELQLGQDKAFYVKRLADRGFHVTSVNTDKADAAEYEVVKGNQTYGLSLDFDKAGKATKVDVTTSLWRSDATKAAMQGQSVPVATPASNEVTRLKATARACSPGPTRSSGWKERWPRAGIWVTTDNS